MADLDLELISTPGSPVVVRPAGGLGARSGLDWLTSNRDQLSSLLLEHGALYLSGLGIGSREEFGAARDALFDSPAAYREKATPRTDFGNSVFSSTDLPPAQSIRQHNENSYTLTFPGKLLFGCLVAPASGGATTVSDVRAVLGDIPPEIRAKAARLGWQLRRCYHDIVGLPWSTAFGTTDRRVVEQYCDDNGIRAIWQGDALTTVQFRHAIVAHPVTGEQVWFNHAAFWSRWSLETEVREVLEMEFGENGLPFDTAFGDATPFTAEEIEAVNAAYDRHTRRHSWAPGDLLLVDNVLSSHGREAFTGERSIVVAMGDPISLIECVDPAAGWAPAGAAPIGASHD